MGKRNACVFVAMVFVMLTVSSGFAEPALDIKPDYVCTNCALDDNGNYIIVDDQLVLNEGEAPIWVAAEDPPAVNLWSNGMIAIAILEANLVDFVNVGSATFAVAALGVDAEFVRYSIEDVNHDGVMDLVLHFFTEDLIPDVPMEAPAPLEGCLTVAIETMNGLVDYSLCDEALFFNEGKIDGRKNKE
ncbi:MAG: hypothetical protein RBT11_14770 [Desulfobacterales bacterium]|nr:hypothetical protein [Desulfobacterales bacterium]